MKSWGIIVKEEVEEEIEDQQVLRLRYADKMSHVQFNNAPSRNIFFIYFLIGRAYLSNTHTNIPNRYRFNERKKDLSQSAGFEPARAEPNRFLVYRLNHSATTAYTRNSIFISYREGKLIF